MANAYLIQVGDMVQYLRPIVATDQSTIRWCSAKVTAVVSQVSLNLSIVKFDGTRVALNAGTPVAKRTSATQTNVWRPY